MLSVGRITPLLLLAVACPAATERQQEVWDTVSRPASPADRTAPRDAGFARAPIARERPALVTLSRTDVDRVLARGPQSLVRELDVEAVLVDRRFIGWRIVRYFNDPSYRRADIGEGDIVTRVNGLPVERPADWMRIWSDLKRSPEIRIESVRDGEPRVIRIPILRD